MRAALVLTMLACLAAVVIAAPGQAASSSTVVTMEVPSATSLVATGCAPDVAGTTAFGTALPGTPTFTTADCSLTWGSSNDSSSLRIAQSDRAGAAMYARPDGTLDGGFATAGTFANDFGHDSAQIIDHVVEPAGSTLLSMLVTDSGVDRPEFRRLDPSGTPDGTFNGGTGALTLGAGEDAGPVALLADGRLVVSSGRRLLLRLANGQPDLSFGGTGEVDLGSGDPSTDYIAWLASDGNRIRAAIIDVEPGTTWIRVRGYLANGSLDTSFGVGGEYAYDTGTFTTMLRNGIVGTDGDIILVGRSDTEGMIIRIDRHGTPVDSFGTAGVALLDVEAGIDEFAGVIEHHDRSLTLINLNGSTSLTKVDAAGAVDLAWGTNGSAFPVIGVASYTLGLTSDGTGAAWATVMFSTTGVPPFNAGVARYASDGTLDTTFGTGGVVDLGPTEYFQFGDPSLGIDGKVVVPAPAYQMPGPAPHVKLARLDSNSIADYSGTWAAGSAFGACLHTTDGGSTPTWSLAGTGNCTAALTANWNAVPTTSTTIATRAAAGTGTSTLRFGLRPDSTQTPGDYHAHLSFEVVAPSV